MNVIFTVLVICLLYPFPAATQELKRPNKLYPILFNYARNLYDEYGNIPMERRYVLDEIASYVTGELQFNAHADLLILGSNNSTRSILVEAWARAAAYYYGISNVNIFSGGLQVSQVSTNAIIALEKAGFIVYKDTNNKNPSYEIKYSYKVPPLVVTSKKYNDKTIPVNGFGTVVVCPNADINLPVVKGNNFRTSLHYFDPVAYDQSPEAPELYLERSREIATEMFYLFYKLKKTK